MSAKPKRPSAVLTQKKQETPKKKKKMSRMQIAFIVISVLIIISMAIPYLTK